MRGPTCIVWANLTPFSLKMYWNEHQETYHCVDTASEVVPSPALGEGDGLEHPVCFISVEVRSRGSYSRRILSYGPRTNLHTLREYARRQRNRTAARAANSGGPGGPPGPPCILFAAPLRALRLIIPTYFPLHSHAIAWKLPTDGPPG